MHRCWLSPPSKPTASMPGLANSHLATSVKFSLTSCGSDSSWTDEVGAHSPQMQRRCWAAPARDSADPLEAARRPVTMTTCCAVELYQSPDSDAGQEDVAKQSRVSPRTAAAAGTFGTPVVYCENSLAHHRPPPRRTLSFPPPTGGCLPQLLLVVAPISSSDTPDTVSAEGKKAKTPLGSPVVLAVSASKAESKATGGSERRVRFADALGFELTSVRVICNPDDPPDIPKHVLSALRCHRMGGARSSSEEDEFAWSSPSDAGLTAGSAVATVAVDPESSYSTCWRPLFPCRASEMSLSRLPDQKVILESIRLETMAIEAVVRVQNLGPVKQVTMRLTDSGWLRYSDLSFQYLDSLPQGEADRFQLRTCLPVTVFSTQRLEFAVRLLVEGRGEFWDNNYGRNYAFVRLPYPHRASCICY